ncbi:MAG TPA: ThiF family adenylyltransferase [Chloroflexota bacterium]|nr:ThiF family adenylyltransferase [Chloroflexota bacterium]
MAVTIVFPEAIWGELTDALHDRDESAAVLIAGTARSDRALQLLVRALDWIPTQHYLERKPDSLVIGSQGYMPSLRRAAADGSIALFAHTHPSHNPGPSDRDDTVDNALASVFQARTGQPYYGSLILGGAESDPLFSGRIFEGRQASVPIGRLRVVGDSLRLLKPFDKIDAAPISRFDRQVRAFGREGQQLLQSMSVGVVGAGGTGSVVCEQLFRLGVGSVTVIDDDIVSETNVTRIYGAGLSDVGKPKVRVVADNAARIGLGTSVSAHQTRLSNPATAKQLAGCDVIFGCTDDNAGRGILSRLAYWYLVPVIDMGFLIESAGGAIKGLYGRITTVMPGTACLVCRRRIDTARAFAEVLPSEERIRLAGEGYAAELGEPDPSVVVFTTLVASLAVNELLERLIRYGRSPSPSELLLRVHDRTLSSTSTPGLQGHYCADTSNWGRGDAEPFLGQMWA